MFSSQARYGAQHGEKTKKTSVVNPVALKHIQLEKNKSMRKKHLSPFSYKTNPAKKEYSHYIYSNYVPIVFPLVPSRIDIYPRVIQHRKMAH
jgi:hypothetical protein